MDYDPVKDRLATIAHNRPWLRRLLYRLLDLLFLRTWYVHRQLRQLLPFLTSPVDPKVHVLDAGTGFGQYAWYIARRFPKAVILGIDVKDTYLYDCAKFFEEMDMSDRVSFQRADVTDPNAEPFRVENRFDFVLCVDVLEHIENDVQALRNFFRSVKPGGYVLINTPSDLGGSDVQVPGEQGFIGEHVRDGYSSAELTSRLRIAGFHVVRVEYGYGPVGSAAWRLLIKWPMVLLDKSSRYAFILPLYYLVALPLGLSLNAVDLWKRNERGTSLTVLAQKLH